MSTAVLATTGQRGSFLSLIDCTLVKICLKEILKFPCSFLLLPVLPFWQTLLRIRSGALGRPGREEALCKALPVLPQSPWTSWQDTGLQAAIYQHRPQAENIFQPPEIIS